MYEGEYFNGKRNGKGKDYYYNGNIKYEGDYKKGKRHIYNYKILKFINNYFNS